MDSTSASVRNGDDGRDVDADRDFPPRRAFSIAFSRLVGAVGARLEVARDALVEGPPG